MLITLQKKSILAALLTFSLIIATDSVVQASPSDNKNDSKTCKALTMRAGGVKGMYQVGILQSLYDHLPQEDIAYDVTTGASIGAVNAATLGMFAKGNETEAFKILYDDWADLSTDQIFANWPTWGPIAGLWKISLFDDTPTHNRINTRLLNPFKRKVAFQTVNIDDGKIYTFDETFDKELQGESVAASASIPVAFQPTTTIGNMHLVDGGTFSYMNLQAAIHKCREIAQDDADITVDMLLDQEKPVVMSEFTQWKYFNSYNIQKRLDDFKSYYTVMTDIYPIVEQNPNVNFRYIISPTEPLPGSSMPIWVNPADLNATYQIGYNDAISAMKNDTVYKEFHDQMQDYKNFVLRDGFE